MNCERARELLAAGDHVEPGLDTTAARAHVRRCAACQAHLDALARLDQRLRPAADLAQVATHLARQRTATTAPERWLRAVLALMGTIEAVLALPLLLGTDEELPEHASRHAGAFLVAVAATLLIPVFQPRRAFSLLPMASVLLVALAVTSIIDIAAGEVPAVAESAHLPEVVGIASLWLLVRVG
ncbi:MAG: hypothetical protein ACT4OX_17160 [Actinomycetota bacterium]